MAKEACFHPSNHQLKGSDDDGKDVNPTLTLTGDDGSCSPIHLEVEKMGAAGGECLIFNRTLTRLFEENTGISFIWSAEGVPANKKKSIPLFMPLLQT